MCRRLAQQFFFWTCGISLFQNSTKQPFRCMPFMGFYLPMNFTLFWAPGEPNSPSDGSNYCVEFLNGRFNDQLCSNSACVMCEIDLT